jgi:hypothetical protein
MKKKIRVREDEKIESVWPDTISGTIVIARAQSGWYRCLIFDPPNSGIGYDGDGYTASEAYWVASRQRSGDNRDD